MTFPQRIILRMFLMLSTNIETVFSSLFFFRWEGEKENEVGCDASTGSCKERGESNACKRKNMPDFVLLTYMVIEVQLVPSTRLYRPVPSMTHTGSARSSQRSLPKKHT